MRKSLKLIAQVENTRDNKKIKLLNTHALIIARVHTFE